MGKVRNTLEFRYLCTDKKRAGNDIRLEFPRIFNSRMDFIPVNRMVRYFLEAVSDTPGQSCRSVL